MPRSERKAFYYWGSAGGILFFALRKTPQEKEKGLSQNKLSKLADVSHATIIKIESGGIQSPTIDTVQKTAKALGVSLDDLTK